ncbi:Predicted metal-dependent hydrolase, TIM-barrel fold [Paracidovorax cattleyae]|uniref:Predicted metal-dependent hydrolase, TIM-barrel fold n=1 Tax=Paracidovorax cattleyae TaxID=80868 RepID=A0A1H0M5S3_9BURK|nr:Predicted metal-dependent hydrolase, TIM-barrel fold [Paracidovorax cattleyae]
MTLAMARDDRTAAPLRFSAGTAAPRTALPAGACDGHVHLYDSRFPVEPAARLRPPDAGVDDLRALQRRIGTARAVLVTPSTYGTDNRCMLEGLAALGSAARGVAVIGGHERDAELLCLHEAGVRGVRLNLSLGVSGTVDSLMPLARRIAPLGWHLQLLMAPDLLVEQAGVLRQLPVPLVFDHLGRIPPALAARHPAHALLLELLQDGRAWMRWPPATCARRRNASSGAATGPMPRPRPACSRCRTCRPASCARCPSPRRSGSRRCPPCPPWARSA